MPMTNDLLKVIAGLTYELVGRPWDVARRVIHLKRLANSTGVEPSYRILKGHVMAHGLKYLFQHPHKEFAQGGTRWNRALRTAGRVGPWGIGFLVWEAYNSGLS